MNKIQKRVLRELLKVTVDIYDYKLVSDRINKLTDGGNYTNDALLNTLASNDPNKLLKPVSPRIMAIIELIKYQGKLSYFDDDELNTVIKILKDNDDGAFKAELIDLLGDEPDTDQYNEYVTKMSTSVIPSNGGLAFTKKDNEFVQRMYLIADDCEADLPKRKLYSHTIVLLFDTILTRFIELPT